MSDGYAVVGILATAEAMTLKASQVSIPDGKIWLPIQVKVLRLNYLARLYK